MKRLFVFLTAFVLFGAGAYAAQRIATPLASLSALQNYISNTLVLANYRRYEAFDPSEHYRKYGFISSSFYAQTGVYNRPNGKLVRHPDGYVGRIANYILDREYETDVRFYDAGRSGTNAFNHLWFMSNFVTAPGADLVLYTNGYTSLDKPDTSKGRISDNYVTMEVLKDLRNRYPDQEKNIALLEKFISDRVDIDLSRSAELTDPRNDLFYDCADRHPRLAFRTTDCSPLDDLARLRNNLGSKVLGWFQTSASGAADKSELPGLYSRAFAEYGKREHDKPNIINAASVLSARREGFAKFEYAFYDLMVGMAEAEGLKFVFYFPPMYELPPDEYWDTLKPFIDRLRDRYRDHAQVYFIDHTFLEGINSYDAYYRKRSQCKGLCKKGHNLGIIGNVKRIRALFADLQNLGLLAAPIKPAGTAFKEEPNLPKLDMCFNIVGVEIDADCAYRAEDYLPTSRAAKTPLAQLYPNAKVTNNYVRNKFFK